jgi:sulfide dehydrogenase cytochrome subunit
MFLNITFPFQPLLNLQAIIASGQFYKTASIAFILSILTFSTNAADVNALNHQENIHTRTLAASCAACHGTQGNSQSITPVLAGLDTTYFSTQMLAFRNGSRDSTVMHRHAKGLTIEEINLLATYFSQQKRISTPVPTSQILKAKDD